MGRWAQRSIRGGGPPTAAALIEMTLVTELNLHQQGVIYSGDVDAALFTASDFTSHPSEEVASVVVQDTPDSTILTYVGDIELDTSITYSGATPGILTPQTIAL